MFGEGQSRSYHKDKSTESSSCFYFEELKLHKKFCCRAQSGPGSNVALAGVSTRVTNPSSRPFVAPRTPYCVSEAFGVVWEVVTLVL